MIESVLLVAAGLVGGFIGAQVGGGALIMLPVLLFLGLEPVLAIGAMVFSGVFLNLGAAWGYWKTHKPNLKLVIPIGIIGAIGSIAGAYVVNSLEGEFLSKAVGLLLLVPIALLLFNKKSPHGGAARTNLYWRVAGVCAALVAGIYGGFLAISATTLFILVFVFFYGRTMVQAASDAVMATVIFSIATLGVFVAYGNVPYALGIPLALGAVVGSVMGARTAVKLGDTWVRALLVLIALATAASLLF